MSWFQTVMERISHVKYDEWSPSIKQFAIGTIRQEIKRLAIEKQFNPNQLSKQHGITILSQSMLFFS